MFARNVNIIKNRMLFLRFYYDAIIWLYLFVPWSLIAILALYGYSLFNAVEFVNSKKLLPLLFHIFIRLLQKIASMAEWFIRLTFVNNNFPLTVSIYCSVHMHITCEGVNKISQSTGNTLVLIITCVRGNDWKVYENAFNSKRFSGTFFVTIQW